MRHPTFVLLTLWKGANLSAAYVQVSSFLNIRQRDPRAYGSPSNGQQAPATWIEDFNLFGYVPETIASVQPHSIRPNAFFLENIGQVQQVPLIAAATTRPAIGTMDISSRTGMGTLTSTCPSILKSAVTAITNPATVMEGKDLVDPSLSLKSQTTPEKTILKPLHNDSNVFV